MDTPEQRSSAPVKSYIFRVVVEDDAMETGEKAYHAYCPALKPRNGSSRRALNLEVVIMVQHAQRRRGP